LEVGKRVNKANEAQVLSLTSRNGKTSVILRSGRGLFERRKALQDQVRDLKL
jgi:hypothetical protein